MIRRELKYNFKNFLIWTLVACCMYMVIFLIYPTLFDAEQVDINGMLKAFPEDMLKAFNMDINGIDNAYGWLKSEGFVFLLMIIGCYGGLLGSSILLKEESEQTIEYLATLPISRTAIVLQKSVVGVFYIIAITLVVSGSNYVGLLRSGEFDKKQYLLLSVTPLFSSLVLFFLCLFLSTFAKKTRKVLGITLGLVFASYLLNMLAGISDKAEVFKYFSAFTLADIRNVMLDGKINPVMVGISILISALCLGLTVFRYNRKELV